MIKLRFPRGKARTLQKGQGLVEYALILVLVAVVVIVITAVLGEDVRIVYCEVVQDINSDIDAPLCPGAADSAADTDTDDDSGDLTVSCIPSGGTVSNTTDPKVSVSDTVGPSNVARVEISLSGPESASRTEYIVQYCAFGGGDGGGPCSSPPGGTLNSGTYTMSATAYDDDGNSGSCNSTFTVP